jgi:hypothetical protein
MSFATGLASAAFGRVRATRELFGSRLRSQRRSDNRCSVHRTNSIQCAEIVMRMVVEKTNVGASSVEREGFSAQRLS